MRARFFGLRLALSGLVPRERLQTRSVLLLPLYLSDFYRPYPFVLLSIYLLLVFSIAMLLNVVLYIMCSVIFYMSFILQVPSIQISLESFLFYCCLIAFRFFYIKLFKSSSACMRVCL